MFLSIDSLVAGNPCSRDYKLMQTESYLDRLLPDLYKFTPPKNSSPATRAELHSLVQFTQTQRVFQNNLYDEALLPHIKKLFTEAGASEEYIDFVTTAVAEDAIPMITKLKYHFNRPRPTQLAPYFDIALYPDFSYFTNNPCYPSGHTTLTTITCEVLGNHFPEAYQVTQRLIEDVMNSRLYLGVHYPSDNDMARVVANKVLENPQFKSKFKL
jgi:membrane-associated phospholipid phosphatase